MDELISINGPVERVGDALVLLIPLEEGGTKLAPYAKDIGVIEGENLKVTIPGWLATRLHLYEGAEVNVHNTNGKLNIIRISSARPAN